MLPELGPALGFQKETETAPPRQCEGDQTGGLKGLRTQRVKAQERHKASCRDLGLPSEATKNGFGFWGLVSVESKLRHERSCSNLCPQKRGALALGIPAGRYGCKHHFPHAAVWAATPPLSLLSREFKFIIDWGDGRISWEIMELQNRLWTNRAAALGASSHHSVSKCLKRSTLTLHKPVTGELSPSRTVGEHQSPSSKCALPWRKSTRKPCIKVAFKASLEHRQPESFETAPLA